MTWTSMILFVKQVMNKYLTNLVLIYSQSNVFVIENEIANNKNYILTRDLQGYEIK
jgi:hypothetical protein